MLDVRTPDWSFRLEHSLSVVNQFGTKNLIILNFQLFKKDFHSCVCYPDVSWWGCSCLTACRDLDVHCQFALVLLWIMLCQQTNRHVSCNSEEHYSAKGHICTFFLPFSLHLSRIRPLSDAVGDLYSQFNTLKDELGKLTQKFDTLEAFVDDLKDGRLTLPHRPAQRLPATVGLRSPLRAQMRAPVREIIKAPALIRARRRGPQRP